MGWILALLLGSWPAQSAPAEEIAALLRQGLDSLAKEDLAAAERAFLQASRLDPRNDVVPYQLAHVAYQRREFGRAVSFLREAMALNAREPAYPLLLAAVYSQMQRLRDARQTLEGLLAATPDAADALLLLGRVAVELEDYAAGEDAFRRYVRLRPQDAEGPAQLGVCLLALEKQTEAEDWLKKALAQDPGLGAAHLNLGILYGRIGRAPEARPHLESAVRLLPEDARAHYQLGSVLVRLDEAAAAEQALRRALALKPDYAEAHYALGNLLRRLGNEEEAARWLSSYERLGRAELDARQQERRLGALHQEVRRQLEQNRVAEAEAGLKAILELDARNDLALYRKAQIAFLRRQYEAALTTAEQAAELKPGEPAYHSLKAMCLERLGRDAEAGQAYRRVVALTDSPETFAALARLALRRGDGQEAVGWLQRAVASSPDDAELRRALAEAKQKAGRP